MKLSILICSLNDRFLNLFKITDKLKEQIGDRSHLVEVIWLGDLKGLTVGKKREVLRNVATGEYIIYIDDDDDIPEYYVDELLKSIDKNPDIITFECLYINSSDSSRINIFFGMDYLNRDEEKVSYRMPYPICAIKRDISLQVKFSDENVGEDTRYANEIFDRCLLKTEVNIPKVMYYYKHNPKKSTASYVHPFKHQNKIDVIMVTDGRKENIMTQKCIGSLHGEVICTIMERDRRIHYLWSNTYSQTISTDKLKYYNDAAGKCKAPIIIFSTNDVIFPPDFVHSVTKLMNGYDVLRFETESEWCFAITRESWIKIGGIKKLEQQILKHALRILKTKIKIEVNIKDYVNVVKTA